MTHPRAARRTMPRAAHLIVAGSVLLASSAALSQTAAPGAPRNPSGWAHCNRTDLSPAQIQICENGTHAGLFRSLDQQLGMALRHLDPLKPSTRRQETAKVVTPAAVLWKRPEEACPGLDTACLRRAVEDVAKGADAAARESVGRLLPVQKAADQQYSRQEAAQTIVVHNGGGGNRQRQSGVHVTRLSVDNRTATAYSAIQVSCGLFETWGDTQPVEPEFAHTIRAAIAANARVLSLDYIDVPWDLAKWGTDAQIIKCRVLGTQAASAEEARAAALKNQAESALVQQRTQAAMKAWDEERERNQREQSADQMARLNAAIASLKPTPSCTAYGQTMAEQRRTVAQYIQARQSAYPLVQGLINQARQMGCL